MNQLCPSWYVVFTLTVLIGIFALNGAVSAQDHDHSQMDHSKMEHSKMDHSKMDHSQMDHSQMDHSQMDHSQMDHSQMDHSQMDHSQMDHSQMDHSQMDHSQMDHSQMSHSNDKNHENGHNHGVGDDMMIMYFHSGFKEVILFDFWRTKSIGVFLVSCFALFVMATLYEGIKLFRESLIKREIVKRKNLDILRESRTDNIITEPMTNNRSARNCECDTSNNKDEKLSLATANAANDDINAIKVDLKPNRANTNDFSNHEDRTIVLSGYSSKLFSQAHIVQTLLHMLQVTVSYFLMLVFMTYNSWMCLSIILGAGLGYFIFGLKRLTTIDVNEHCH